MSTVRGRRDDGQSLVELIVAMSLATVILTALVAVVIGQVRTSSQVSAKVDSTADAHLATDTLARRLRVAVPPQSSVAAFESVTPTSVTFFASIAAGSTPADPPPSKVTYSLVPATFSGRPTTCLQERRILAVGSAPPYTYPSSSATTSCLAHGDVNPSGGALFTFHSGTTGSAVTTDPSLIRSVGIDLELRAASGTADATTRATTRVTLPNIRPVGGS